MGDEVVSYRLHALRGGSLYSRKTRSTWQESSLTDRDAAVQEEPLHHGEGRAAGADIKPLLYVPQLLCPEQRISGHRPPRLEAGPAFTVSPVQTQTGEREGSVSRISGRRRTGFRRVCTTPALIQSQIRAAATNNTILSHAQMFM